MFRFIFYIVFLFSCFNFETAKAADSNETKVIFAPIADDEPKTLTLPEASNLPHPLRMQDLMTKEDTSWGGKLIILARYFDARYPGDQIEADFKPDLAQIFPEADEKDLDNTEMYLRFGIKLYRLVQEKISDFKTSSLLPKDPPLIVPDDEYAVLGDQPYIKAPENQFAIVSDFKKVIGYGHNLREKQAMDDFLERRFKTDEAQTDFEHFTSMLDKIEWDKILQYGISLPSPFIGNAGIGKYTKKDDFKIRLLSEEGRLGDNSEILAALHVFVPNHRFMLATSLDETHLKPEIKFTKTENIKSYEVFYPVPLTAVSEQMIGAYRGDFAFPIKLSIIDPKEPITLEAKLTFENCDAELICQHEEMDTFLKVGVDETHRSIPSSVQTFIRKSYYNLPPSENKNIKLRDLFYTMQDDETHISFDFTFSSKIKNFAFTLENDNHTTFSDPEMVTSDGHIYLRTHTLKNGKNVLSTPLTLSVRLNDYDSLRQTIVPDKHQKQKEVSSVVKLFLLGIWVGFGFYLTFFGLPLLMDRFLLRRDRNLLKRYTISKILTSIAAIVAFSFFHTYQHDIFYFEPTTHPFYIVLMFFILISKYMGLNVYLSTNYVKPAFYGFLSALLLFFAFPLTPAVGFLTFVQNLSTSFSFSLISGYVGLLIGIILPDILNWILQKKIISQKLRLLAYLIFKIFILTDIIILLLWILIPLTFLSILKIVLLIALETFLLRILFHFWQALYHTDLPKSYISGTQNVIMILLAVCIFFFSQHISKIGTSRLTQTQSISLSQIKERVFEGENILLALYAPNCIKCIYNDIIVFNSYTLERLKQFYNVTYLPIISQEISPDTRELLEKYKRYNRPLYVLFSPVTPNGIALQDLIFTPKLFSYLDSFHFEVSSLSE